MPLGPHIDRHTILRDQGAQIAIAQVAGLPWELEAQATLAGLHNRLNTMHRNQADPRLTIGVHLCKLPEGGIPPGVPMRSSYGRQLDADYREHVLGAGLSRNVIYVSIAYEPDFPMGKWAGRQATARSRRPRAEERQAFKEAVASIVENLTPYGVVLLGLRPEERDGETYWYSQVGEALYTILYGRWAKVPMAGRMGRAILRDRPVFGPRGTRVFEIRTPGVTRRARYFGTILALTDYPAQTITGMLNNLLSAPFGFVLSQTFGYRSKAQSLGDMALKQRQMHQMGDAAVEQAAALPHARSQLMDNRWVMGTHHLSLAVYAPTLAELDTATGRARNLLLDTGAVVTQEDWNLDAAFWAQLPGGWHKIYRKGKINSANFAALAPLHNYPAGGANPRWGRHIWQFRSNGGTLYQHDLHAGEVGATFVTGRTGLGKSVLLNTFLIGGVERLGARCVFFDVNNGAEPCIRAIGGSYLALRHGVASGLAPHLVLGNTTDDQEHWYQLARACIVGDSEYRLTQDEEDRLRRGVAVQLSMPAELRSWTGLRTPLGYMDREGAGARLEKWCEGGALGWVFANDRDDADFGAVAVGIDTTTILDDAAVCGPMMAHLAYRTRKLADGHRLMLIWDELHKPLANPAAAALIDDELRTIRKKEGVPILATQGPTEIRQSIIGATIREQTPTKIAFASEDAAWADYEWLGFTPAEFRQVSQEMTVGRKRFLMKRTGASVVCDFDLSPIREHLWVLSGRTKTAELLAQLRGQVGDDPEEWLPLFIEQAPRVVAQEAQRKPQSSRMETTA
ncbi:MAG: hypothetical protein EON48_07030 [Acetobacteraceae bacterium]|nr:MAG: hypothetical protein EON48_07030 [Acetobacteraceae bacterium]